MKKLDDKKKNISVDAEEYDKLSCYQVHCQIQESDEELGNILSQSFPSCDEIVQGINDSCAKVTEQQANIAKKMQAVIQKRSQYDFAMNQLQASSQSLQDIQKQFGDQINQLREELKKAPKPIPIEAAPVMSQKELDANWMPFTFDSETSLKSVDTDSKVYKSAATFGAFDGFWFAGASVSHSKASQDIYNAMSKANVSIAAKVLRVTFSRNWFRPSLFSYDNLEIVSSVQT